MDGNKVMWAGGGMGRGHQADSVLFVGVCVFVGLRAGWVGMIGHQMLLKQQNIYNPHLS